MQNLRPIRKLRSNEELFFEHYPQLLEWAIQLTQLNHADAEDLVQDFYIQVAHIGFSLDEVEDIRPYLFKILRNLYYSRLRQKSKIPISDLSALDYDSVEKSLGAVDWRGLFLVRSNLKQLCEFACQRKHTARSASIFLLRFFLGYYPSEVMKVVQTTRVSVDKALQYMRGEAQRFLDKAVSVQAVSPSQSSSSSSSQNLDRSRALFLELQQIIFNSCEGPCFDADALKQHYREQTAKPFTTKELAHLVSCRTCLDHVNTILGLPLLDERSPDDTIGRNNPSGGSSVGGPKIPKISTRRAETKPNSRDLRTLKRGMRDWFEHRPACLEIAINGETRTSQRITAEISELHLKLNRAETPEFIEIFSEQGTRILYLHVLEPSLCPGLQQREMIDLSDDRSLSLTLSFAGDLPTVHVVYRDPVFAQLAEAADEGDPSEPTTEDVVEARSDDTDASSQHGSVLKFPERGGLFSLLDTKPSRTWFPRMSPFFATGLVLAFASILCFVLWTRSGQGISAHDLLLHAQRQDASVAQSEPSGVIVQRVRIKSPVRTMERTVYRDIQRRRHPRDHALDASDAKLKAELTVAGVDWDDPLSPVTYQQWRNREFIQSDSVKRAGDNLLTLTTTVNDGAVVSESLTVRSSDFHAVGKTVELRDYGTIEIAEVNYAVLPWSTANPDWFEPAMIAGPGVSNDAPSTLLPRLPVQLNETQLDEAELSARLVLNQLHADTGEQIEIVRDPSGIVVKGIVETEQRRRDLNDRLHTLPHMTTMLSSLERMKREQAQGADAITGVKVASAQSHATPLVAYYLSHGRNLAPLGRLPQQLLNSAFAVGVESRAIGDLQRRFARRDNMSLVASAALSDLLFTHKHKLLAALDDEEHLLAEAQIDVPRAKPNISADGADRQLADLAEHNLALARELALSNGANERPAESIASELAASIDELYRHAHAAQVVPQNFTSSNKRK